MTEGLTLQQDATQKLQSGELSGVRDALGVALESTKQEAAASREAIEAQVMRHGMRHGRMHHGIHTPCCVMHHGMHSTQMNTRARAGLSSPRRRRVRRRCSLSCG